MVYNFSAGPAVVFGPVLQQIQNELQDYKHSGYSLLEESHRSAQYRVVHEKAISLLRQLLILPEDTFEILLLGGGATLQFSMLPFNFLQSGKTARYVITGAWGKKAFADAQVITSFCKNEHGSVSVLYQPREDRYTTLPHQNEIPTCDVASTSYVHITSNETIDGIQWKQDPEFAELPLVADISSDIASKPMNVKKYSCFYAGAQKNIGVAGVTVVVLRKSFFESARDTLPSYLSYKIHAKQNSLHNTPPVFAIWTLALVLEHIQTLGGLSVMSEINERKAAMLYGTIENSGGFFKCPVEKDYRSTMNVVFRLPSAELDTLFLKAAAEEKLLGLKGHRSVGGIRASLYNAMPEAGVKKLVSFMEEFCKKYG